jgi:hypothetical protein
MAVKLPVSMFPASGGSGKALGFVLAAVVLLAIVASKPKAATDKALKVSP